MKMEKNVMRSMELVGRERMEVAVCFRVGTIVCTLLTTWLSNNFQSGVKVVTTMSQMLPINWESSSTRLANSKTNSSTDMINIVSQSRASETSKLQFNQAETVRHYNFDNGSTLLKLNGIGKQKITDQIAQLKYKEPNSPRIVVLEQELVRAEAESLVAEAQLSNITREKLKAAFTYQFDALREHSEKLAIIAGYGKHLLELVDDTPVTPGETRNAYDGYETSKAYVARSNIGRRRKG